MDFCVDMSFGDSLNDKEMIIFSDYGIAMGNADECLKVKADWISSDVEQDGLRNAIKHAEEVYSAKMV